MTAALLQTLLVYAVVALCTAYSLWRLLPAALKRHGAAALMSRFPRLQASARLRALMQQPSGCGSGCGSCSSNASRAAPVAQEHKIQLVRRR
ncbi:MAG: hypothetical protein PSV26_13120 [Polaromonas sp.]|uniref:DUF6587 family protein n=1 Tax=Polaromonas sp. TaxID=1869339 RepID=UPI00248A31E6|nr:DUF6587 family protein [Polaromonas sp.]MDI1238417.1 hypothetical protein [Polaromonas sp.]